MAASDWAIQETTDTAVKYHIQPEKEFETKNSQPKKSESVWIKKLYNVYRQIHVY